MIKLLKLKNYQSHQDSVFEFGLGVNCIVGKSDAGKSSSLRAIYWILTNRPAGTDFIRTGSGSVGKRGNAKLGTTEVELVVERQSKEIKIIRTRGQDVNACTCGDKDFSTIGKDVPEEVLQALNLDKINIQRQLDPPFLILDTPGNVATTLNKFTNLDKGDEVVSMLSSELRDQQSKLQSTEEQLKTTEEALKKFTYLDEFEKLADVLDDINKEGAGKAEQQSMLAKTINTIEELEFQSHLLDQTVKSLQPILEQSKEKLQVVEGMLREIVNIDSQITKLSSLLIDTMAAQARLDEIRLELPTLSKELDSTKLLSSVVEDIEQFDIRIIHLGDIIEKIESNESRLIQARRAVTTLNTEFASAKKEFEDVDECPTCGQKLKGSSKQVMLENL